MLDLHCCVKITTTHPVSDTEAGAPWGLVQHATGFLRRRCQKSASLADISEGTSDQVIDISVLL